MEGRINAIASLADPGDLSLKKIAGNGGGVARIAITYQTCDAHICMPPATIEMTVPLG